MILTPHVDEVVTVEGFGELLSLAEERGWADDFPDGIDEDWTPDASDAAEESALDYLSKLGVLVIDTDEYTAMNLDHFQKECA